MTQSVVIGLFCSDWSDDPVCCDWSTLLIGQIMDKFVTNRHSFVQEVRMVLLTTHFRQFVIGSFVWETITPFICTLIFESFQTIYIHKQLYYSPHERGTLTCEVLLV